MTDRAGLPPVTVAVRAAFTPDDVATVRELILEYQASLGLDLAFQHFADEVASLATTYGPPGGGLFLATIEGLPAGCVGVRPLQPGCCEMKRLYVRPSARGHHLGGRLAEQAMTAARALGYTHMRLDTLPSMHDAQHLYVALGFYEIPAYRDNPVAGTRYLEVAL
jgi:putative acetyltransferase